MKTLLATFFMALFWVSTAFAGPFEGTKKIIFHDNKGGKVVFGTIDFMPKGDKIGFKIHKDHKLLTDHFLSMREFKCLTGPSELACYVNYPYNNPSIVSADNLGWLESALIFIKKTNKEFGVNMWNGMLYKMTVKDGIIHGELRDIDLNYIASPPDDLTVPPYNEDEQTEPILSSRWLPRLTIE
ncbi:MAG: hypothetical protein OQJ97_12775 [Rhodospirillales bacterium]|nr:hypothetical protein [Rhodospirillales bacterium]